MKKILALISILALLLAFAGCTGGADNNTADDTAAATTDAGTAETSADDTATAHEPYELNIYTWTAGSSTNTYGIALADIINSNSTWLHATALVSESQNANANILINNEQTTAIGYCVLPVVYNGYPPFEEPNEDLQMLAAMAQNSNCYMTLDPDIKTLEDLDGKKVMLGNPGGYLRCDLPLTMFEYLGIEPEFSYGGIPDSVEALINGQVDAIIGGAIAVKSDLSEWVMASSYTELMSRFDVYFISTDKEGMEYAMDQWNFESMPGPTVVAPAPTTKRRRKSSQSCLPLPAGAATKSFLTMSFWKFSRLWLTMPTSLAIIWNRGTGLPSKIWQKWTLRNGSTRQPNSFTLTMAFGITTTKT
jgi:TRAP-type uncharacterized transport system substrate-binding protein